MDRLIDGALRILADLRAIFAAPMKVGDPDDLMRGHRELVECFLIAGPHQDAIWYYELRCMQALQEAASDPLPPPDCHKFPPEQRSAESCQSAPFIPIR